MVKRVMITEPYVYEGKLIFEQTAREGFPVVRVTVWETPTSFATYRALS